MMQYIAVGAGGCLGAVTRYWLTGALHRQLGSAFPYGTLAVNVVGCLALGGVMGLVEYRQLFSPNVRLFVTVGILGGLTTFSTFGYETFQLLHGKQYGLALTNVVANMGVGVIAVIAGWFAARLLAI